MRALARARRPARIELLITRHEQIQVPIAVVVEPRATGAPFERRPGDAASCGDVGEPAASEIAVQTVRSPIGHVKIDESVVVVVARAHAAAPAGSRDAGRTADIGEPPVPFVVIEAARRVRFIRRAFEPRAIDEKHIERSVVVVVHERDAGAVGLDDVPLGGFAARESGARSPASWWISTNETGKDWSGGPFLRSPAGADRQWPLESVSAMKMRNGTALKSTLCNVDPMGRPCYLPPTSRVCRCGRRTTARIAHSSSTPLSRLAGSSTVFSTRFNLRRVACERSIATWCSSCSASPP